MNYFDEYLKKFDLSNQDIKRKYGHSYRVKDLSIKIAKYLQLSEYDTNLAGVIGLIHDIGRFEQLRQTNSFDDFKGFDHAEYGVEVLKKDLFIKKFWPEKKDYDVIFKSVKNHNKYQIEDNLNARELIFSKIIRDADKIDIIYIFSTLKDFIGEKNWGNVSENVKKDFYQNKQINLLDVKTKADKLLSILAMVFDLNYLVSVDVILKNKYFETYFKKINNKELFKEYFDIIQKYMSERMS